MQLGHFAFVPEAVNEQAIPTNYRRQGPGNIFPEDEPGVIEFDFYSTGFENGVALPTLSQGDGRLVDRLAQDPTEVLLRSDLNTVHRFF